MLLVLTLDQLDNLLFGFCIFAGLNLLLQAKNNFFRAFLAENQRKAVAMP